MKSHSKYYALIVILIVAYLSVWASDNKENRVEEKADIEYDPYGWFPENERLLYDGYHRSVLYESEYQHKQTPCYIMFCYDRTYIFKSEHLGGTIIGVYSRETIEDTVIVVDLKYAIASLGNFEIYEADRFSFIPKQIKYKISGDTLIDITRYNQDWEARNPLITIPDLEDDELDKFFEVANEINDINYCEREFRKFTKYIYKYPIPPTPWWNYTDK